MEESVEECKNQRGWRIPNKEGPFTPLDQSTYEFRETEAACTGKA